MSFQTRGASCTVPVLTHGAEIPTPLQSSGCAATKPHQPLKPSSATPPPHQPRSTTVDAFELASALTSVWKYDLPTIAQRPAPRGSLTASPRPILGGKSDQTQLITALPFATIEDRPHRVSTHSGGPVSMAEPSLLPPIAARAHTPLSIRDGCALSAAHAATAFSGPGGSSSSRAQNRQRCQHACST